MISAEAKGSFSKLEKFLKGVGKKDLYASLSSYGAMGVSALASATPTDSGLTAHSWTFTIENKGGWTSIIWHNTNVNTGIPIAIIIQYGHGTGTGGWVEGRDYINPAIQPVFDKIVNDVWKQVTNG